MSLFKPAPAHNPLYAPAACLCVECCHKVLATRCPATNEHGQQCGSPRHRGSEHYLVVATVFQIAEERTRL